MYGSTYSQSNPSGHGVGGCKSGQTRKKRKDLSVCGRESVGNEYIEKVNKRLLFIMKDKKCWLFIHEDTHVSSSVKGDPGADKEGCADEVD